MKKFLSLFLLLAFGCNEDEIDPYARNFEWADKEESIEFLNSNFPEVVIDPQSFLKTIPTVVLVGNVFSKIESSNVLSDFILELNPANGENFKINILESFDQLQEISLPHGVYTYNESTEDFEFVSDTTLLIVQTFNEENEQIEIAISNRKEEDWNRLQQHVFVETSTGLYFNYSVFWLKKNDGVLEFANFDYNLDSDNLSVMFYASNDIDRDYHFNTSIRLQSAEEDEFGDLHTLLPYEYDMVTLNQTSHGDFGNGSDIENNRVTSFFEYDIANDKMIIQLVRYNRNTREELWIGNVVKIDGDYVIQFEDESTAQYPFIADLVDQVKFIHQ